MLTTANFAITVFHASFVACKSPVPWPRIICTLCARHSGNPFYDYCFIVRLSHTYARIHTYARVRVTRLPFFNSATSLSVRESSIMSFHAPMIVLDFGSMRAEGWERRPGSN